MLNTALTARGYWGQIRFIIAPPIPDGRSPHRPLAVRSMLTYSDADMNSMFVKEADEAYRIGAASLKDSYLRMDTILDVVKASGAQAVHPGYGFLSENLTF